MLKFDDANLERVAALVHRFNPHAVHHKNLVGFMKAMADRELAYTNSYVATLGFMLTTYTPPHDPANRYVKASLDTCMFQDY